MGAAQDREMGVAVVSLLSPLQSWLQMGMLLNTYRVIFLY